MAQRESIVEPWFEAGADVQRAPLHLVCIPYAGGGSSLFRGWDSWLSGVAGVHAVRLPGRESRINEPAFTSVHETVSSLLDAMRFMLDRPLVLFGYSMGALIAYELARALEARSRPAKALIVAASPAPHLPRATEPSWHLPAPEFLARLHDLNGTPPELLSDPELMELFFPLLRADFQLVETYEPVSNPPLESAIRAYAGVEDEHVPREQMEAWSAHTRGHFSLEIVPGGHFFIRTSEVPLVRSLKKFLAGLA